MNTILHSFAKLSMSSNVLTVHVFAVESHWNKNTVRFCIKHQAQRFRKAQTIYRNSAKFKQPIQSKLFPKYLKLVGFFF